MVSVLKQILCTSLCMSKHGLQSALCVFTVSCLTFLAFEATAQETSLSGRAKALDTNNSGLIERKEARGPLKDNFDTMDCDKNGGLDGREITGFFTGAGCPKPGAQAKVKPRDPKQLGPRSKAADANNNGVIDPDEAGGPLLANFKTIDTDNSGTLDGLEIKNFFTKRNTQPKQAATPAKPGTKPKAEKPSPTVQVDRVIEAVVGQTFPVIGRLVSSQSGVIAAEVVGGVREMRVNVGDRVAKGDIIAVIDDSRLLSERNRLTAVVNQRKAMVTTAKAQLDKAAQEARRMLDLRTSAAFSRARHEDIQQDVAARQGTLIERKAHLKQAEVQLKRSNIDLADTKVRAPYGGVILEKHIDVGSYLKVGDRIVSLLNDRAIEVEAEVPTEQIYGLNAGLQVIVTLDDNSTHTALVRAIVPQENLRTRTRTVRFTPKFKSLKKPLAADQTVTVLVPLAGRTAITVHKDAIIRRGQNAIVFLVKDNSAFARQVELGRGVGTRFVVRKGLKPGDMVVIRGNERLGGGGKVTIIKAPSIKKAATQ